MILACDCNAEGVKAGTDGKPILGCNSQDGKCECKENYDGRQCDACADGYYGEKCASKDFFAILTLYCLRWQLPYKISWTD